jgi:hypothetical protein
MNRLSAAIKAFMDAWRSPAAPTPSLPAPAMGPSPDEYRRQGAAQTLSLLQRDGRLIDFLNEALDQYSDEQIGAAVREIHANCRRVLEEHFPMHPILDGAEGEATAVSDDLPATAVRWSGLSSDVVPSQGILRHHGWRIDRISIPELSETADPMVVAPAQLEVAES